MNGKKKHCNLGSKQELFGSEVPTGFVTRADGYQRAGQLF